VIADILLGHYIIGDAMRISPEAPVSVVAVEGETYTLGPSANVARNAITLSGNVKLCGAMGDDRAGIQLPHILSNRGIFFNERFEKNHVNSIAQTCVVVRGQQLCHVDRERKKSTDELSNNDDLEYIKSKIDVSNTIILSE
jgi:D-beta-D-heptose 7-phosphate kinase/D-beta-D-heptose 1-phosphate adenosyltransferase